MLGIQRNIYFLRLIFSCSLYYFQDPEVYILTIPRFWQLQLLTAAANAMTAKNKAFLFI